MANVDDRLTARPADVGSGLKEEISGRPGEKREKVPLPLPAWLTWRTGSHVIMAVLGAHYHELNIALPTAGSKTGRTIRKPALLTVLPAREHDSRKRDERR